MKVVSPKSSSKIYIVFTVVTVLLAIFFLTSNRWMQSITYKSKSNNYDQPLTLNCYNIKITDASYHDNSCEFVLKCRISGSDTGATYPEIKTIRFDDDLTEYKFTVSEKYDDYSRKITVNDPPSDFKIMRVVVRSALPDTKYADAYDEFGEKIPAHTEKGKGYIRTITIDRKDMQKSAIKIVPGHTESHSQTSTTSSISSTTYPISTTGQAVAVATKSTSQSTHNVSEKVAETSQTSTTTSTEHQAATAENNTKPQETRRYDEPAYAPEQTTGATHNEPAQTLAPSTQPTEQVTTTTQPRVYSIKLATDFEFNDVQLKLGEHTQIRAEIEPDNAVNKNVKWESNRPDIVTVDSNGNVTAETNGKAIITATTEDKGLKASCMITVS